MNIAITCWSFSGGGFETRLRSQIAYLQSKGHKVYCIFGDYKEMNKITPDTMVTGIKFINLKDWSFDKEGFMPGYELAETIEFLKNYFTEHEIDIVDIHTDFTLFASTIAAGLCGIPATYTVHGPGGIRFFDPIYKSGNLLTYILLQKGIDRVYCVADYLKAQCSGFVDPIILRNGVDKSNDSPIIPMNGKWAYVSRLDEWKIKPLIDILDVIKRSNVKKLDIYGDGPARSMLETYIKENGLSEHISLKGWIDDTLKLAGRYDCIMGVGRVVLESCASGTPTVLLSDLSGIADVISLTNIGFYKETNFTSRHSVSKEENLRIINQICKNPTKFATTKIITNDLISDNVWAIYEDDIKKIKKNVDSVDSMKQIYLLLRRSAGGVDFWNDDSLYALLHDNYYNDVTFVIDAINARRLDEGIKRMEMGEERVRELESKIKNETNLGVTTSSKRLVKAVLYKSGVLKKRNKKSK